MRVPTVRYQTEGYLKATESNQCTLIRINPDYPFSNYRDTTYEENRLISIMNKGLPALQTIDKVNTNNTVVESIMYFHLLLYNVSIFLADLLVFATNPEQRRRQR